MGYSSKYLDSIKICFYHNQTLDLENDTALCSNEFLTLGVDSTYSSWLWSTQDTINKIILDGSNFTAGIHELSLQVTDTNGCDYSDTINIEVFLNSQLYLGKDTTICENHIITLNGDSSFCNWYWSTNDTSILLKINGSDFGVGTHNFYLSAMDSNNCISRDTIVITINDCSGINLSDSFNYSIYPNPAKDYLKVVFSKPLDAELKIKIFNVEGKQVIETNVIEGQKYLKFPVGSLNSGVWYFQIIENNEIIGKGKFVKQ